MKKYIKILKYSLFILLISMFFMCCENVKKHISHYKYETLIEIKYIDNTIDTIKDVRTLYYRYDPKFYIKTKEHGFFQDTPVIPCLSIDEPSYGENIACSIKRFKIISQNKIPIE